MSTESTTKQAAPLRCPGCGDEGGPFDAKTGRCEDCTPAGRLRSALEDGGHLGEEGLRLMGDYRADVLRRAADTLRKAPGCESAARIVDRLARLTDGPTA